MINSKEDIYRQVKETVQHDSVSSIEKRDENIFLIKGELFEKTISALPPHLNSVNAPVPLSSIYTVFSTNRQKALLL